MQNLSGEGGGGASFLEGVNVAQRGVSDPCVCEGGRGVQLRASGSTEFDKHLHVGGRHISSSALSRRPQTGDQFVRVRPSCLMLCSPQELQTKYMQCFRWLGDRLTLLSHTQTHTHAAFYLAFGKMDGWGHLLHFKILGGRRALFQNFSGLPLPSLT